MVRRAHPARAERADQLDVIRHLMHGQDEMSEERRETERAWRSLPIEEQARIYDAFGRRAQTPEPPPRSKLQPRCPLDPTIETPTSSLLLRTTRVNPRLSQPDLDSDRVVLSNSLRGRCRCPSFNELFMSRAQTICCLRREATECLRGRFR